MPSPTAAASLSLACTVAAAIAAVLAFALGGHATRVTAASPQPQTRAQLVALAKQYVSLEAERQQGISVDRQRVQGFTRSGSSATVTLAVDLTDGKTVETFVMVVTLTEGLWQPLGYRIQTIHAPPPIGIPAS